jgi:hypothetical protein
VRTGVGCVLGVVLSAAALTGCGSAQHTTRHRIAVYLTAVNRIERQLVTPLTTVDRIDREMTTRSRQSTSPANVAGRSSTVPSEERSLRRAEAEIQVASARLRALPTPPQTARLQGLLLQLTGRQSELTRQTIRLIDFIPGFTRSLGSLGPAVIALERALSVNQASGAGAVQLVYARKVAALHAFVQTLSGILRSLGLLRPPASSEPTYLNEQRSLRRMSAAASALASDLASGHTTGLSTVLQSFDRAAALPGSRPAQSAEIAAVRAYDRQVGSLGALVAAANQERLRVARRYQ